MVTKHRKACSSHHQHPEGALNLNLPFDVIQETYYNTTPNIVVIDDFMNLEALQKLKEYCLEFPFWNTIYGRGYLGGFRESGFSPTALSTLSLEMIQNMPKVFDNTNKRNLSQMWAFKYESKCCLLYTSDAADDLLCLLR